MTDLARSAWVALLPCLAALPPRERGERVRATATSLGVSVQTGYAHLRELGWTSGRARRSDAGATSVDRAALEVVAERMARGRNKRGQANLPASEAHAIARERGEAASSVSYGHLCRLLRREGLSLGHQRAGSPAIARVSSHPNHVWLFDISVGLQWYFRDPEGGRGLALHTDAGARFYEGKRANFSAARRIIHRFVAVDHYSGCYFVRYYYSAGEAAEDVVDFLWRAMSGTRDHMARAAFRGVPRRLVMDQGSANRSQMVRTLLEDDGLGIQVEYHAPGNARASGAVESRHYAWQRGFEARLALAPSASLDELNRRAELWCADAISERPIVRAGRALRPPLDIWHHITREQLVEAPERETFLALAASSAREGVLTRSLLLRAAGRVWQIAGEGVYPGARVTYRLAPRSSAGVRVWSPTGAECTCAGVVYDTRSGQVASGARHHVWDSEDARGASPSSITAGAALADRVQRGEREVAVPDVWAAIEEREAQRVYLDRIGTAWVPPATAATELHEAPRMASVEARMEVVRRLGHRLDELDADQAQWWQAQLGDGVTEAELEALWIDWMAGAAAARARA